MIDHITDLIHSWGVPQTLSLYIAQIALVVIAIFMAIIANFVAKKLILKVISLIIQKSKNTWDDIFLKKHVFDRLSHLAPAIVFYLMAPVIFPTDSGIPDDISHVAQFIMRISLIYIIIVSCRVADAFFNAIVEIYRNFDISKEHPIQTYIQFIKIVLYILTGILAISVALDKSPVALLTGLGAMTAVLMLVFKDTISGFVASIQLTANNMIKRGDWIEMAQFGADGDVIDISVHTVKVQNWDKTITTIPTASLVNDSFKNWRGMSLSGGRRIKRTISIDVNSIKFCDQKLLDHLRQVTLIKDYLETKENEIKKHNQDLGINPSQSINGRCQTNIGIFRAYLQHYLKNHPLIHKSMTLLVRQLQSGPHGLPIEIYVFSSDQDWINFEGIQSDLFDHIFAILPKFELKAFQYPSGSDLSALTSH